MGIEDRDYTRDSSDYTGTLTGFGIDYIPPVVKWLIIINVAIFLLEIFVTREVTPKDKELQVQRLPTRQRQYLEKQQELLKKQREKLEQERPGESYDPTALEDAYGLGASNISIIGEWLQLDTRLIVYRGQVWRLLTYAFCHEQFAVFHILLNMLALYWFGVTLESMYGPREFLLFYLAAAVVSGLANVGLDLYLGSSIPAVGASGAVLAVLTVYAIHYPRNTIRFWFYPIEVRWVVLLYAIFDLHPVLLALGGNQLFFRDGTAHAAHLGGLAFGFLYWKFNLNLERWWNLIPMPRGSFAGGGTRRPPRRAAAKAGPSIDEQVDEILRKIHDSGEASLTDAERRLLARASEKYKERRGE